MIVAFTKYWNDVPTCTTHILREMAKTMPVLWVSSIGTRKPSAASGKDFRRMLGRVLSGLKRAEWKENQLRVLKPILVPKAESAWAKWINRKVFAWYVRRERKRVDSGKWGVGCGGESSVSDFSDQRSAFSSTEYWCFVPNAVDLLPRENRASGRRGESEQEETKTGVRVIYYCADDWTQFHNLDGEWMAAKERELVERADAVFVTSRFLETKFSNHQPKTSQRAPSLSTVYSPQSTILYMPHGVEYERFAEALDKTLAVPEDVAGLPKPVVGFYGNLHPWVDLGLVGKLAQRRPDLSFVLIGEIYTDVAHLTAMPNVHLLGRREHYVLHQYCRGFDVAIIPYDMAHPRMVSVNPVKTKELLAAGLPIVASAVPELMTYGDDVLTCSGVEEWCAALDRQLARRDRAGISGRVQDESWTNKVALIRSIINAI